MHPQFYRLSFANHIFVLFDDKILCFTPPSLLKFVILVSNPEWNHWGSVWRSTFWLVGIASPSITAGVSFFSWMSWPGSGCSWFAPELVGLRSSTEIIGLFSPFSSGCLIGDTYQLGWIVFANDRSLTWPVLLKTHPSSAIADAVVARACQESCACGGWGICIQVFCFLLQLVVWYFRSILHLKKRFINGLFLWANIRREKWTRVRCLIFPQYLSVEN